MMIISNDKSNSKRRIAWYLPVLLLTTTIGWMPQQQRVPRSVRTNLPVAQQQMPSDSSSHSILTTTATSSQSQKRTMNRELAADIWQWEQRRRQQLNLPRIQYSVRAGLRWVDDEVAKRRYLPAEKYAEYKDDLIQDGLTALLDAMSQYRDSHQENKDQSSTNAEWSFELYARRAIRRSLSRTGSTSGNNSNRDTKFLSVEDTVEIFHPHDGHERTEYKDQEEWDKMQRSALQWNDENDDATVVEEKISILDHEINNEMLDENYYQEGDDEAWVQQEQIAGPLQELIPDTTTSTASVRMAVDDTEPSVDDLILPDLIRSTDMKDFLVAHLDPAEIEVVQATFGFDQAATPNAQSQRLDKRKTQEMLRTALDKLRKAYRTSFVDDLDDGDDEFLVLEEESI